MHWYKSYKGGIILSFRRYMTLEYGQDWLMKVHQTKNKMKSKDIKEKESVQDYLVGLDAISRALGASFWEWDEGSTVFFWRWTKEHRKELRDGLKVWFKRSALPSYWGRQRWPQDIKHRNQLKEKIEKVVKRRYIATGFVKSLTGFFAVPKGVGDIRVVYDGTKSGLNDAIWTPSFFLPTIRSVLNHANEETFYGDIDIGEMFLNYFLDPVLRPWAGVDVTELFSSTSSTINPPLKHSGDRLIMRWECSLMGVRSSPFNCVRAYLISEEIIMGDRKAVNNPFRWDRVVLNLPGSKNYDPSSPWIYRFDDIGKTMAAFVQSYVDDLRTGSSQGRRECEKVTHVAGSKLNYLGEQDASRKRGEASQEPGAWAGSVIVSKKKEGVFVTVSQEKWDKVKDVLDKYHVAIMKSEEKEQELWIDYKQLEKDTGFLVHVFMTYEHLKPYLKGFYLTMNSWRYDREGDGWKKVKKSWEDLAEEYWNNGELWEEALEEKRSQAPSSAPERVIGVSRFREDVKFLSLVFKSKEPKLRLVRGSAIASVVYGFGDASGAGFGASWVNCCEGSSTAARSVKYRFGRWGGDTIGNSSNFRELRNLVDTLAEMGEHRELSGVEVFLFTDNSTAEAAFNRGSSSNKKLYGMVKEVKLMEMIYATRIHIVHVAGTRMIDQGTDGLSRGCLTPIEKRPNFDLYRTQWRPGAVHTGHDCVLYKKQDPQNCWKRIG